MKHTFVLCLSVLALLASCSQDEFVEDTSLSSYDKAISFSVSDITDDSDTRSTLVTSSNWKSEMNSFSWFAVDANGKAIIGTPYNVYGEARGLVTTKLGNNVQSGKVSTDYLWKTYEKNCPLTFYAFSGVETKSNPSLPKGDDLSENGFDNYFDTKKMILYMSMYNTNETRKINRPSIDYPDAMIAIAKDVTSGTSKDGSVSLKFRHLLSRVRFYASCDTRYKVTVSDIRVMYAAAFFNYNLKTGEIEKNVERKKMSLWFKNTVSPSFFMEKELTLKDNPEELVPGEGALFFAPQEVQTWSTKNSIIYGAPTSSDKAYTCVHITCRIYDTATSKYIVGSESGFGSVYYPISGTWEPGKCYNYYFRFDRKSGFGYDGNGNHII